MNALESKILLACSRGDTRLFRNTVGQGWSGKLLLNEGGRVVLSNARRVSYGLCVGSSDHIGWSSLTITPDMVGQRFARFLAIEAKDGTGRASADQKNFIAQVIKAGGLAGVARDVEDARRLIGEGVLV